MKRAGVDVGGTFTDLILVDEESGRITVDKVPSTPEDPARGVVEGVRELCAKAGVAVGEVDNLLHGTTVATNIVLTHTGAEVGLLTTHGFRDILHIARHKKPYNFSLQQELPWQSRLAAHQHRAGRTLRASNFRRHLCCVSATLGRQDPSNYTNRNSRSAISSAKRDHRTSGNSPRELGLR